MKLFNLDGPFQKYASILFDLFLTNLVWILCVILTLGIGTGAATTALFYAVDKSIVRDKGYVLGNFFKSFKSNFVKSTLVWLILAAAYAIVLANIFVFDLDQLPFGAVIVVVSYIVLVQLLFITCYIFQLIARIEIMKVKDCFFTAFKLANRHFLITLLCLLIAIGIALTVYTVPFAMMLSVSTMVLLQSKVIIGFVLKKYYQEGAFE